MDDEVEITDVNDDEDVLEMHKVPLENQDLTFLHHTVGDILAQYGWFLIFVLVGVILLVQYLSKRRASQSRSNPTPETAQDSLSVVRRQEALEASRKRMQEELDAKAVLFKEKQKQLEEEKRRQKIEMWESMKEGRSYKPKPKDSEEASSSTTPLKPKSDKKALRGSGYNPLSGDGGGSCSWRPGRRGPSAGG